MAELQRNVAYLELKDFDPRTGALVNPQIPKNIPVLIMAQAGWCGHCTTTKPAFQQLSDMSNGKIFCATINSDTEKDVAQMFGKGFPGIQPVQGYPTFLGYKGGKYVKTHSGDRSLQSLQQFAQSL